LFQAFLVPYVQIYFYKKIPNILPALRRLIKSQITYKELFLEGNLDARKEKQKYFAVVKHDLVRLITSMIVVTSQKLSIKL
jgi:hypothetical protein